MKRAIRGVGLVLAAATLAGATIAQARPSACERPDCLQRSVTGCASIATRTGECHWDYRAAYTCPEEGPIMLVVHFEHAAVEKSEHMLGDEYVGEVIERVPGVPGDKNASISEWECCDGSNFADCVILSDVPAM